MGREERNAAKARSVEGGATAEDAPRRPEREMRREERNAAKARSVKGGAARAERREERRDEKRAATTGATMQFIVRRAQNQ